MTDHSPEAEHSAGTAVRLDQGHVQGAGGIPERFENPGLPPHIKRGSDLGEGAARRAERIIAGLFGLSMLGTLLFLVAYFLVDVETQTFVPVVGRTSLSNVLLGVGLALALLGIGLGAVQWAKTLMSDEESVEERHPLRSTPESRDGFVDTMMEGGETSQLTRRPLLKGALIGSMALFPLPILLQVVGSLGPLPKNDLSVTWWNGRRDEESGLIVKPEQKLRLMTDPENEPIKPGEVTIGSVFHVMPEGLLDVHGAEKLNEKSKAAVLLMRLKPEDFQDTPGGRKAQEWGYEGIVAYSKICTHVGCPVGLYEQTTHHLLCPCHQSTFDVTNDCEVIFGPAKRPLPQLKITVENGYLVADQPFQEPVGPSFWERES